MPDLDAGARTEPQQTSGAPHPGTAPRRDGLEHEAHPVPTREELEACEPPVDENERKQR